MSDTPQRPLPRSVRRSNLPRRQPPRQRPGWIMPSIIIAVVLVVGAAIAAMAGVFPGQSSSSATVLTVGDVSLNNAIDGIPCSSSEALTYHVHAHLTLYVDGQDTKVPAGIGIGKPWNVQQGFVSGGSCFSWLHTHDDTGAIHIEAPSARAFTLGQFFHLWGQSLDANTLVGHSGPVTAYLNQKPFSGDPTQIPLEQHANITLEVGKAVPAAPDFDFRKVE